MIFPTENNHYPSNMATREHVIPRAHGGENNNNLVIACLLCNSLRGDMDATAFYNFMNKYFRRNPEEHECWHLHRPKDLSNLQKHLLSVEESRLRGLARKSLECAFLHIALLREHGHRIQV